MSLSFFEYLVNNLKNQYYLRYTRSYMLYLHLLSKLPCFEHQHISTVNVFEFIRWVKSRSC